MFVASSHLQPSHNNTAVIKILGIITKATITSFIYAVKADTKTSPPCVLASWKSVKARLMLAHVLVLNTSDRSKNMQVLNSLQHVRVQSNNTTKKKSG